MSVDPKRKTINKDTLTDESLPELKTGASELEDSLVQLSDSFQRVITITNPVQREYKIVQEARELDIPLDSYRRMFVAYGLSNKTHSGGMYWLLTPISFVEQWLKGIIEWVKNLSLYQFAAVSGQITVLVAMTTYFLEAPHRHQEAINNTQKIVDSAIAKTYSQARIDALERLSKQCASFTGLEAKNAVLTGIQLNKCYRFQEWPKILGQWPPQFFKNEGFNLSHANLQGANLQGANLQGANLQGANLQGANLQSANLQGANLQGANLQGANLQGAKVSGSNLQGSKLQKAILDRANISESNLQEADLMGASLIWSNLQQANLNRTNFQEANLNRANLQGANLFKANLKKALLIKANFLKNATLWQANFDSANLTGAKFLTIDQLKSSQNWRAVLKNENWEQQQEQTAVAKPFTIGVLRYFYNDSFFKNIQKGIEQASDKKNIKLLIKDTNIDAKKEAEFIKEFIQAGVDAILISPADAYISTVTIKEAYEAGILIFCYNTCINKKDTLHYISAHYESDQFSLGYETGNHLAQWQQKNSQNRKEVNVGILHCATNDQCYDRLQGFRTALKDSAIQWREIAFQEGWSPDQALTAAKGILQNHPDINVLWAANESGTEGAVEAVRLSGLQGKVFVFGTDISPSLAQDLLDGDNILQAVTGQSPEKMGQQSAEAAIAALNGGVLDYKYQITQHHLFSREQPEDVRHYLSGSK